MLHGLVICIGNTLRGDDGAAARVAALLDGRVPDDVRVVTAPQLDLDMADDAADARTVLIVDAERRTTPLVEVRRVDAAPAGEYGHALEPGHLLDIAWALYSARPMMSLVTLAAPEMEHGEGLSPVATRAALEGAAEVLRLLGPGDAGLP